MVVAAGVTREFDRYVTSGAGLPLRTVVAGGGDDLTDRRVLYADSHPWATQR
jgi:hypothetical protein